ncbi:hypothetical protein TSTA_055110 [Talaromyces stipitatus ATCC 10500]|uniref:PNPLA domain-containing protein n=1 Tax=Talaromyces stipitatus (strain ATCC 10500 / CBS 375.48 / QM 6759 / NRRL 1006) TaxID=441959 RepID=B8MRB0_TALSN|nr:uncharacterized protein TSTA_055110 [Talaromyces stipitatus ATCC 10500]EED13005.1 hypothetical protein TSTA_055110 [Talaromyces stipitatus ATCC 10500]
MKIESCISKYLDMGHDISHGNIICKTYRAVTSGPEKYPKFSVKPLENTIKELVEEHLGDREMLLRSQVHTDTAHSDISLPQSKSNLRSPNILAPIRMGNPEVAYTDGRLWFNNPIRQVLDEISDIWQSRRIGCIISIGTGVPPDHDVGLLRKFFEGLLIDTEMRVEKFEKEMESIYTALNKRSTTASMSSKALERWD